MKFIQFMIHSVAASFSTIVVALISFFALDQTYLFSLLFGFLGGAIVFFFLSWLSGHRFLRRNGISRREYSYIKRNLKEAKVKINRLQKSLIRVGNLSNMKQSYELIRLVNKIYTITKKEPRRFFQAERFYFTHLDSIVELSEKHAFLASQPAKTKELTNSLHETRMTIQQLTNSLENDLYKVLEDDIDDLNFELDVAKHAIKKTRTPIDGTDRRTIK
jgi:5-bromo-4-chloroindolyl phosphate hydrolysis protein